MLRISALFIVCLFSLSAFAQQESHNGWFLPPNGFIRVLVIYAEVNYDVHPKQNPHRPAGIERWKSNELPVYANELFDPQFGMPDSKGIVTQFFDEASFGQYQVTGDYLDRVVTVNESEMTSFSKGSFVNEVIRVADARGQLKTGSGITDVADFDHLTISGAGKPKPMPSTDDPHRWDHLMIVFRNLHLESENAGWANRSSLAPLYGYKSDTYSVFRVSGAMPFFIARHEFAHLLFGGNNFHVGGGQHNGGGENHFISSQGGWSTLGGANSSFLTCNAWDRDRMGWKLPGKNYLISALDEAGNEISSRIDNDSIEGIFVLRDFVSTGDAIQIKLPGIPANEYQQYLWIENHQTYRANGSRFDRFHYQHKECIDEPTAGLYLYLQAGKDQKTGNNIYGDFGDYLRPISAEGFYDYVFLEDPVRNDCINTGEYRPFEKLTARENALTGSHDQEFPTIELQGDGRITRGDGLATGIERVNGTFQFNFPQLGDARDAFTKNGNSKIGIGSNPSTASMMTLVSLDSDYYKSKPPNNRSVWLNGISVEILEEQPDGAIKVRVRQHDTELAENRRWCADEINLPAMVGTDGYSLVLAKGRKLTLDRGETATRIDSPDNVNGQDVFNKPTTLNVLAGANILVREKAQIILENGSTLKFDSLTSISLEPKSELVIGQGCTLILPEGAMLNIDPEAVLTLDKGAEVHFQISRPETIEPDSPTFRELARNHHIAQTLEKDGKATLESVAGGWTIVHIIKKTAWRGE